MWSLTTCTFMKWIALLCLPVLLTSCYSYRIYPKEKRHFEYHGERSYAYVTNPELKREYKTLQRSGIFILTNDSLQSNCVKIELHPTRLSHPCGGMGLLPFMITAGVV